MTPTPSTNWILERYLTLSEKDKQSFRNYLNYLLLNQSIKRFKECIKYMLNVTPTGGDPAK
jgi:hypothetical protein